jgi:hypothetical protein
MGKETGMNIYTCQIDLRDDAKALAFAIAVDHWMEHLRGQGAIGGWRLLRRKLGLAAGAQRDFLLEIEVADLTQLDQAFRVSGSRDEDVATLYRNVHALIAASDAGVYRPFPDAERAERLALI